jgi:hypothetical protein
MMSVPDIEMPVVKKSFDEAEAQIRKEKKNVDFDVKEYSVEYYVDKYNSRDFFIPRYQRGFVWDDDRQSKLIESIILGLPVPPIFTADVYGRDDKDEEGDVEIVDGSQRIRTLAHFVNNKSELTGFDKPLQLQNLEILSKLNGMTFEDFPRDRKKRLLGAAIKMIQFSEDCDADVRFMMFERINSGNDELNAIISEWTDNSFHSTSKLKSRIEFVRDKLLGQG